MPCSRFAPGFGAVLALLFAPQLALAGPIEWSYSAHIRTTTGLGVLNLGTERLYSNPPTGDAEPMHDDYVFTAPVGDRTVSGRFPEYEGQPNDSIRLLSVGGGWRVDPVASAPASDPTFLVTFTLTDLASGQSGTIEYVGRAGVATDGNYPPLVLFSADMTPETTELKLGRNRYRVTAIGGLPDEIEEPAVVGVSVAATADTPEPGTLALGGVGFALTGLLRVRRRLPR
ncbi:MAG TPA: PEP-CTERM sorting domain-containing protein [Gemmataceae bacterium]|nr:PEP-CTERM sorting domain-containing protein [Gemmataceae bacterium]